MTIILDFPEVEFNHQNFWPLWKLLKLWPSNSLIFLFAISDYPADRSTIRNPFEDCRHWFLHFLDTHQNHIVQYEKKLKLSDDLTEESQSYEEDEVIKCAKILLAMKEDETMVENADLSFVEDIKGKRKLEDFGSPSLAPSLKDAFSQKKDRTH